MSLFQARAVALVQRKGGIQAAQHKAVKNKDKAVLPEFQDKVQKRLNTSDDEGELTDIDCNSKLTKTYQFVRDFGNMHLQRYCYNCKILIDIC